MLAQAGFPHQTQQPPDCYTRTPVLYCFCPRRRCAPQILPRIRTSREPCVLPLTRQIVPECDDKGKPF